MDYKLLAKAILLTPVLLAAMYALVILSYLIVPLIIGGIFLIIAYAIFLLIKEAKESEDIDE